MRAGCTTAFTTRTAGSRVKGPGRWHFAALAGAEMGPGYVIV